MKKSYGLTFRLNSYFWWTYYIFEKIEIFREKNSFQNLRKLFLIKWKCTNLKNSTVVKTRIWHLFYSIHQKLDLKLFMHRKLKAKQFLVVIFLKRDYNFTIMRTEAITEDLLFYQGITIQKKLFILTRERENKYSIGRSKHIFIWGKYTFFSCYQ